MACGGRRQLATRQRADFFEPLQTLCQHIGADARKIGAQIAEPFRAEHQFAHHQQRPTFANEIKRMRRPAGVVIAAGVSPLRSYLGLFSYFS